MNRNDSKLWLDFAFPSGKYEIDRSKPGRYDLIVLAVADSDAGLYMCRDDRGFGSDSAMAELVVLEQYVSCATNVTRKLLTG